MVSDLIDYSMPPGHDFTVQNRTPAPGNSGSIGLTRCILVPQKGCIEILALGTSEWDLMWK